MSELRGILIQLWYSITQFNMWRWSGVRWFGLFLSLVAMCLIGHFSSWWVSLGVFLWTWATNIDNSNL